MPMSHIALTLVKRDLIFSSDGDLINHPAQMKAFLLFDIAVRVGCIPVCAGSDLGI